MNKCGDCRNCCSTRVKVSDTDISNWKKNSRYDILLCLEQWPGGKVYLMQKNKKCIFLGEACDIYNDRPQVCRNFPLNDLHKKQFDCKL